ASTAGNSGNCGIGCGVVFKLTPTQASFNLSVVSAGNGSGTVTSNPAGISCGTTCSASFLSGTVVTLTAAAAAGSTFAGWSGACVGTGTCSVTMTAAKSVTATFNLTSGPVVALSHASLNFGTVAIGATSGTKTVTLTNVGTTTLTISGIAITGANAGDFAQTHTCGSSLAAGASCAISVTFKPTASGTRTAVLSVSDNRAEEQKKERLRGVGTVARLSPDNLSFGTVAIGA